MKQFFFVMVFLGLCTVALAQSLPIPTAGSNTLTGPITVVGPVDMTTGPMRVDGGVSARDVRADMLNAGPATLGPPVDIMGPMTVTGVSSFSQPPTGLTRKGVLTRGAALGLAVGCQSLGTVTVAGVTQESACAVTNRPPAILNLGIVLDCFVTSPNTVTVRACALLALLSAPSGNYGVTLVGE